MYSCIHIYIYIYTHTYIYVYIYIYIYPISYIAMTSEWEDPLCEPPRTALPAAREGAE